MNTFRWFINLVMAALVALILVFYSSFTASNSLRIMDFREAGQPLPENAAVSLTAPDNGWTRESFLAPQFPHLGVSFGSAVDEVDEYRELAGHDITTSLFFKTWANHPEFKRFEFTRLIRRGIVPVLSWEPWDNSKGLAQPEISLSSIARGDHDDFVRSWAAGIASLEAPIVLRFGHEMNGHWYPWSAYSNGNTPEDYVAAWRHLHMLFEEEGAENVIWCFSVNVNRFLPDRALQDAYPGDSYVDLIGISGYSVAKTDDYRTVYESTFSELQEFSEKPVLITEIGVGGERASRPDRILSMLDGLASQGGVIGYVWFQKSKREDWKIDSTPATLREYQSAARSFAHSWLLRDGVPPNEIPNRIATLGFG